MIVYGDRQRVLHVRRALDQLARSWAGGTVEPVSRLIEAGELACGLLDWMLRRRGFDDAGPLEDACHQLVLAAAQPDRAAGQAGAEQALARLAALDLPAQVAVNAALEGFSHYAVTPEQYARAGRYAAMEPPAPQVVIGIRSIGLPLGAAVAAALGSGAQLVSVRPSGHPFHREIRIGEPLRRRLRDLAAGQCGGREPVGWAVVDEGPGLSGSSFAAVSEWLETIGVAPEAIALFPSHGDEPGPEASARTRRRFAAARRYVVDPDLSFLTDQADAVDDLAAGRWRYRLGLAEGAWPPADGRFERRKLIIERGGRSWLYKFAGLGRLGALKAERARHLAARGHHPEVGELVGGFLACEWHDDARPLSSPGGAPVPRGELVDRLADYLALRAELAASEGAPGASPEALLEMARHNLAEEMGAEASRSILAGLGGAIPAVSAAAQPVATDGRLHRWEWIALPDGRLYKTDAVDHALGHDLVGEQDLEWDLAGAAIELALTGDELDRVRSRIGRPAGARGVERFYRIAYAAFQLGAAALSESLARAGGDELEAGRLATERARYRADLERPAGG